MYFDVQIFSTISKKNDGTYETSPIIVLILPNFTYNTTPTMKSYHQSLKQALSLFVSISKTNSE
ncbi:hypothetical protein KSF78_0003148 [Schistosoma japonicum]|nr:hypothetical protein KSF78_0003148 [Schistosoma japonicum]